MSALVPCHACGRPVAVGASCPSCGSRGSFAFTGQPEAPASRWLRLTLGVAGVLLFAALVVAAAL